MFRANKESGCDMKSKDRLKQVIQFYAATNDSDYTVEYVYSMVASLVLEWYQKNLIQIAEYTDLMNMNDRIYSGLIED
jgi:hypothetical protein